MRSDAEAFVQGQHVRGAGNPAGSTDAVDVLLVQSSIEDRLPGSLQPQGVRGPLQVSAVLRRPDADNGDLVLERVSSGHGDFHLSRAPFLDAVITLSWRV